MADIKRIGVLTSGGDAPGMNACIRAVVRRALVDDLQIIGIRRGLAGLIEGDFVQLYNQSVSNILQLGGTLLKSTRSRRFETTEGRELAAEQIRKAEIDALVAIGGNGTLKGVNIFYEEHGIPVVGIPGTIDNDLYGTDETIGFDTALNTAIENIDRIRDTADAHDRLFLIEVMGKDSGFIALNCGIGGGAELVLIPETVTRMDSIKGRILSLMASQSRSSIVVVAEGEGVGGAYSIAESLRKDPAFDPIDLRVCVLGHIQRGGSPSARDRVLASRLGVAAVDAVLEGHQNVMVGIINGDIHLTPLRQVGDRKKEIDFDLVNLSTMLS